jgi:hypothetical protein
VSATTWPPAPAGDSRWLALPGLVLVNLVPLALVVRGDLATEDLLLSYLVELYVLLALWAASRRRRPRGERGRLAGVRMNLQQRFAIVFLPLMAVLGLTWSVVAAVTWDRATAVGLAVTGTSIGIGLFLTLRQSTRGATAGMCLWRGVLLATGAWVGLGTAANYTELQGRSWDPAPLGEGWALPFGRALVEAGLALGVPAAVVPVLFVVVVRTVNEVLYEAYDVLRDSDQETRRTIRPPRDRATPTRAGER